MLLHHVGLWLVNGKSWKRSQSNNRNMFALSARVLGPGAFSLPARIDEEGRKLRGSHQGSGYTQPGIGNGTQTKSGCTSPSQP